MGIIPASFQYPSAHSSGTGYLGIISVIFISNPFFNYKWIFLFSAMTMKHTGYFRKIFDEYIHGISIILMGAVCFKAIYLDYIQG